jgi:hypothetical protein
MIRFQELYGSKSRLNKKNKLSYFNESTHELFLKIQQNVFEENNNEDDGSQTGIVQL